MQFMIKALDGEGKLDKRMEVRPQHLEGMKKLGDRVIVAGGILDDEGKMKGSMLVVEFPDRESVDEYLREEPYIVAGVWKKVEVDRFNVVIQNPR